MKALVTLTACFLFGACAAKRLPPGTPPPEYEIREPAPWAAPDAGTGPLASDARPSGEAAAPPNAVAPSLPPSEIAPDAGPAVVGPSPDAGVR